MTSILSGSTVAALRRELAGRLERAFAAAGREGTPALDARLLVAHALGVDASALALHDDAPVDPRVEAAARAYTERRIAGEPVARILGGKEFWGLDFALGPDTLVPRPDTETLVEAALAFVERRGLEQGGSPYSAHPRESGDPGATISGAAVQHAADSNLPTKSGYTRVWQSRVSKSETSDFDEGRSKPAKPVSGGGWRESLTPPGNCFAVSTLPQGEGCHRMPLRILDIGTGSGAILLALLSELPNATGIGTDLSAGALAVAAGNAARLGLAPRAAFVRTDWAAAVAGPFDLVLSNPPYVRSGDIATLPVEVARHDPHLALDGGADGLAAYRAIISDLGRLLATGGKAFLEIGLGQAAEVAELAAEQGFAATFRRDLAGIERVAEIGRIGEG